MFFGPKKRNSGVENAATQGDRVVGQAADRVSWHREVWRRQSVTRTWSQWSAADGRRRSELYGLYTSALDAEELAAARLKRALEAGAEAKVQVTAWLLPLAGVRSRRTRTRNAGWRCRIAERSLMG
jgi:hypothetical protein